MILRLLHRRRASALQDALHRYEQAIAAGVAPDEASRTAASRLGRDAKLLSVATGMGSSKAPMPEPAFAKSFAERLRRTQVVQVPVVRARRPRMSFVPAGAAACVVAVAALLFPAFHSLPGDALHAVKDLSEDARVWIATGTGEARVHLELANERFEEVEGLVQRAQMQAFAPGTHAVAIQGIDDPELISLIEATLVDAGMQLQAAVEIFVSEPTTDTDEFTALVEASQRGQRLAADVAEDIPPQAKPPVLITATRLAQIEADATAAQQTAARPSPTPDPCLSPSPTPEPSDEPSPSPDDTPEPTVTPEPTATATASATGTAEQAQPELSPSPTPDPCVTPTPTPSPTATPTAVPTPTLEPQPTDPGAAQEADVDAA